MLHSEEGFTPKATELNALQMLTEKACNKDRKVLKHFLNEDQHSRHVMDIYIIRQGPKCLFLRSEKI